MSMQPVLRFKTKEYGLKAWDKTNLSKIATVTMGQSPSSDAYNEDYDGLPLIQGNADIVDGCTKPSRYTTEVTKRCQESDVILSVRAPVGEVGIASEESCIGRGVCAIRANDKSDTAFIYQLLQAKKKQWKTLEQGSTFTAVSGEDVKEFEVAVPTKEEQQKIAAFFTALDEKVALTEKALSLTERITKVVLEKIYKGELRFKLSNGTSFPRWKVRKLDHLVRFQNGINASKEQFGTGIKLISVKEVLSDVPVTYDSIASSVEVDNKEAKRFYVEYGDIVFQRSSETAEEAGSANVYLDSRPAVFGGFVIRGKKIADYHPQFMKMALRSKQVRRQIVRLAQGAQHINIGQEQLSSVEVQLPCMGEQEKIAELITNFEHKKATLLARLNKLKRLKQAFMQQMFV